MMKRWLLFLFIVGPILYLLAFGLSRDPRELPSALVGQKAPDFSVETTDGKKLTLADFSGTPLVINFWATWCGPCFYEQSVLKSARATYEPKGVKFLGIVYQDSKENVVPFLKELGEPFIVLFDPQSKMAIDYGVAGVPETFFISADGIIRKKFAGGLNNRILEEEISKLKAPRSSRDK